MLNIPAAFCLLLDGEDGPLLDPQLANHLSVEEEKKTAELKSDCREASVGIGGIADAICCVRWSKILRFDP